MFIPSSFSCGAEAPCSHVVELAKEQVERTPNVCEVFKRFARVSLQDAEHGCHSLFKKFGYTCPLKVETIELSHQRSLSSFPFLKVSTWAQWLLDSKRIWRLMCGCKTFETMRQVLGEFWRRYKIAHPQHQVFDLEVDLSVTIPFFSHQDEGKGYKHQAIWIFSLHAFLGRGCHEFIRRQKHQGQIRDLEFGCNYTGNTWANHFLICTMLRSVTHKVPEAIDMVMKSFPKTVWTWL